MGGGDRLVRGLASSNGVMDTVVDTVMGQQDGACGGSAGHSQEGEADKGLKENLSEKHLRSHYWSHNRGREQMTRSESLHHHHSMFIKIINRI